MHIALKIVLYSYVITTIINLILLPIKEHKRLLKEHGKRKAYIDFTTGCLFCLIPYIVFILIACYEIGQLKKNIDSWVAKDPTNPKNIADPDIDIDFSSMDNDLDDIMNKLAEALDKSIVIPTVILDSLPEPINSRFDILDL